MILPTIGLWIAVTKRNQKKEIGISFSSEPKGNPSMPPPLLRDEGTVMGWLIILSIPIILWLILDLISTTQSFMFSLASLGLLTRGAGAARVGSGSSSPLRQAGDTNIKQREDFKVRHLWHSGKFEAGAFQKTQSLWNLAMLSLAWSKKQDETEGQLSWTVLLLFFCEVCGFYVSIDCARKNAVFVSLFEGLYQLCNILTHTLYGDLGLSWSVWFLRFCCIFSNRLHKYCVCTLTTGNPVSRVSWLYELHYLHWYRLLQVMKSGWNHNQLASSSNSSSNGYPPWN